MTVWKYTLGAWEEIEDPLQAREGETDEELFERNGYYSHPSLRLGPRDGQGLVLHSKQDTSGDRYPVVLFVCPFVDCVYTVMIYDFLSLMQFLKDYAPAFSVLSLQEGIEFWDELFEKTFHALHGHGTSSVCVKCDPIGWERARKWAHDFAAKQALRKYRDMKTSPP